MQNVAHNSNCDRPSDSETNEIGQDHSGSSSPLSGNISVERGPSVATLQAHYMAELSESEDDDVSDVSAVDSFILEQGVDDENDIGNKFLLNDPTDGRFDAETQCRLEALLEASGSILQDEQLETIYSAGTSYARHPSYCNSKYSRTSKIHNPEIHESLEPGFTPERIQSDVEYYMQDLEFSDDMYANKEVLKRLTSSVNCALDEAAAALSHMRPCTLAEACSHGDLNTVKKLLDEGRNVNEVTEDGESLLSLASSSGYKELAQLLLAMNANVDDRGMKDMTPLMEAANAGHLELVKLLIQHGADVNAQTSQEKKMKGAKAKNQDLSMKAQQEMHGTLPSIVCPEGNTPLMFACAAGHEDIVKVLLDAGAHIEDHNENGHTPLMEAASAGHVGVAKLLVERGASINTHSNEFKESALTLACYKGHLEMVRFLLEAGADREHKTDEMHTALMEASMDGHVEVARLLLDSGAQVNMPADSFESPLTLAACGGHVELAMLLLDRGANIEEVNDEGYTPLMEAAREGHEEMVALLLSQGADINAQTEETQETALTLACCGGFLEVSDFLIKAGADIELGASTPLMEAAQEGHLELVRYLIGSGANVNATTATGDTALTYACENGHTDVADLLLQANAKLEHESEGGRTPLMKAARAGHLCTVQFLISKGANVNKQTTNNDHNPLSLACAGGHLPIVELLLAHGADPTHKLKDNSTMIIEASKGGHTAVVQLLLDYPNSLLASPPPPPELSQVSNHSLETSEAPRVPPHGLQVFPPQEAEPQNTVPNSSCLVNPQSAVPRIQDLLHESLPNGTSSLPKPKSVQRKSAQVKNNEAPSSSFCENTNRYHYRNKNNAAAQVNSMSIQTENVNGKCVLDNDLSTIMGGGGGILDLDNNNMRPSERLEACINSMMKKAEMMNPSPEEQIFQKQQILEELQRVERELQEKAQAQLLLNAQHQNHHQNLQGLGTIVTGTPTVTTLSNNNAPNVFTNGTGAPTQQLLINNGTLLDIKSLSAITDISSMSNQLGLNLRSTSGNNITFPLAVHAQQIYHQHQQQQQQQQHQQQQQQQQHHQHHHHHQQQHQLQQQQHQQPQQLPPVQQQQKPLQPLQQPTITSTSISPDYCKARPTAKPTKQPKTNVIKQVHQQSFQTQPNQLPNEIKVENLNRMEDMEKINFRNIVFNEQQQMQLQQQMLQQHTQQQFVLSEFTQNLTLRGTGTEYCDNAIAGIMHAMGGLKLSTDNAQTHAIPMYDPVSVGQALLQQQLQQQHLVQHQQLTQVLEQETKRVQQQQKQQSQQQQQQQHIQFHQQLMKHYEKYNKPLKGKPANVPGQTVLQTGQTTLTSFQNPTPDLLKQQFAACGEACTLVGNIPLDGTGVLTLTSPPFPVSIAVSPVSLPSPVSVSSSCGASFAHNLSLDEGLMVAAPARTLHETLGDIMTGPTTQLAGNQMNLVQQGSHCSESCLNLAAGGKNRSLSMSALTGVSASTSLPLTYHTLPPSVAPCVPIQVSAGNECISHHLPHLNHVTTAPSTPAPPLYPPPDLNSQTDSNHDTALTLACAGGHEELVSLLLSRGADIEHRDKKGFTPLMLAATAGHAGVVDILLNHGTEIEAQSERTKDTALSLACSGGRYEVVDILLARGANKEHRNVSDYTPLSLAASGGYVNIIKLLLSHGAEINSRTGSKLGISPLMLASMNGHVQAVKLLLDMGSDINAQIETNRNTALTLACFQGRHEVVSLLLDRKANVEHRAKTGLTPLMEAASGGYVEVGKVLIDKGADVNAPPVPSSRDTALTIACDKGHYRFVQLLLERDAIIDVKNKKGDSTVWLAANSGHLEVIQLLVANNADIDSQDNRKVSCLMAAFRKGHIKVVKWMVKHVTQFPSDQEMARCMSTVTDKELLKKCSTCVDIIRVAKEKHAAEANKNANILLEELDLERSREESRKAAAARRRERKRRKKREKQEQLRAAKSAAEESKKSEKSENLLKQTLGGQSDQSDVEDEDDEEEDEEEEEEEEKDEDPVESNEAVLRILPTTSSSPSKAKPPIASTIPSSTEIKCKDVSPEPDANASTSQKSSNEPSRSEKRRERDKVKAQEKMTRSLMNKMPMNDKRIVNEVVVAEKHAPKCSEPSVVIPSSIPCNRNSKKRNQKHESPTNCTNVNSLPVSKNITVSCSATTQLSTQLSTAEVKCQNLIHKTYKQKEILINGISGNAVSDYEDICALIAQNSTMRGKSKSSEKLGLDSLGELALDLPTEVALTAGLRSPSTSCLPHSLKSPLTNSASPKKWQKRDEGWKEVVRRSKKVSVPANAISRVIGRGGMNINAIREGSGAHIEVEKQKGQGERTVIIRGSAESTRLAQQLITALIKEPEKELSEILTRCGLSRVSNPTPATFPDNFKTTVGISNPSLTSTTAQVTSISSQNKSVTRQQLISKTSGNSTIPVSKTASIPPPSLPANATPPFTNQIRSVVSNTQNIRPGIPVCTTATPPFLNNAQNAWTGVVVSGKVPANVPRPSVPICTTSPVLNVTTVSARVVSTSTVDKSPVARQLFPQEKKNSNQPGSTTATKTTVSYTMAVIAQGKTPKTIPANLVTVTTKVTSTSDTKVSTFSPITMERAGSAPPSTAVHTQMNLGHNSGSGPSSVQPFASNHSPKLSSGSPTSQQNTSIPVSRMHISQPPMQSKPFVGSGVSSNQSASTSNPSSTSPTGSQGPAPGQSNLAQEYSPFNNIFAKVAQSVWGQKDKETKPNFASVAASGVTSVASQIQNSNPVQSTLTLSLPQSSETDLMIDVAKAPGYRGNLHISPSACSSSPASSSTPQVGANNSNFGPIGSGPRSAPCTPPLGPIGPPSSASSCNRRSTPPAAPSPPPPNHRNLPESQQNVALNDLPRSMAAGGGGCPAIPPSHMTSQMSEAIFHHQSLGMSSHPSRLQSYPMAPSLASPGGTNTTFSQHTPLSSVGTLPEGSSNGNMQVVQSNLNPNAPDFSSRASLLMAQHTPPMHHLQRLPSGPNAFQENAVPPHLAQFRPILASGNGLNPNFPLHAMANAQAQALNRFNFHHVANHQQQTDFNSSPAPGAIGPVASGMSQGTETLPLISMVSGYHHPTAVVPNNGNIPHHYPGLQSMIGIRPTQRSASTTPSVGTSSKDEGSPMAAMSPTASPQGSNLPSPTGMNLQENHNVNGPMGGEDRKLPRPIGMERAQRKNPMFGAEIPVSGDWIHNMQGSMPGMPQEEANMPPSLHNYSGNRFPDMLTLENNHPIDQTFQAVANNAYPFMNGLPPHMIAPHLYQNNAAATVAATGQVDAQIEMWGVPKVPLSSGGDGLPQNVEPKMNWQSWSSHQA